MPWGIGAVGSALEWHSRGHGFKSRILHSRKTIRDPPHLASKGMAGLHINFI